MMNTLSKETGFFYMMYMKGTGNYYKCWIDGSAKYEFFTADEILDFAKRTNNPRIYREIKDSFRDSSIFIWMVDEEILKRARLDKDSSQIKEKLEALRHSTTSLTSGVSVGYKSFFWHL